MKKNRMMRLASVLLVCVLLTTSVISGTFAKYTSTAVAADVATVAKWDITVNGEQIAVNPTKVVTFNLFDTINDTYDGADEEDVDDDLIAPGTKGEFALKVINNSEVDATYSIVLEATNSYNVPLEYSLDGTNWYKDITQLNATMTKEIAMNGGEGTNHNIQWRWVYSVDEAGDTLDTALGIAAQTAAPQVTVSATITVTQVD